MFGMFEDLAKAAVGVVINTPVALVSDAVTLGDSLTDKEDTYTEEAIQDILRNLRKAVQ